MHGGKDSKPFSRKCATKISVRGENGNFSLRNLYNDKEYIISFIYCVTWYVFDTVAFDTLDRGIGKQTFFRNLPIANPQIIYVCQSANRKSANFYA